MNLLLDTHTFIWWASAPSSLSKKAFRACVNEKNNLILSVVSAWEMQVKQQLGKLELEYPVKELISLQQEENDLHILPVSLDHVLNLDNLPLHHRDPFDRMLIAQAMQERLLLVSRDNVFSKYPVQLLW